MVTALRSYFSAGLAVTTAGLIAVVPPAPASAALNTVHLDSQLTAGEEWLNVPLNLFQALVNIPANEIHGLDTLAKSLFYSGPWMAGSPTNAWGEDPGDMGHFEGILQMMFPFPLISGAGHEGDRLFPGLGQQLSMLSNVEIPINLTCAGLDCYPVMPTSPITGFTWIDQPIWSLLIALGLQNFPLIQDWFQVPFSDMTNGNQFYFDPNGPGMVNIGYANDMYYWEGTRTLEELGLDPEDYPNIDPEAPLQPWAGSYYAMDFTTPFTNFYNSLFEPFDVNKFDLPDPIEGARALQSFIASSLLAFNPFIPGSPLCPGPCLLPGPGANIFDPADWDTPSYFWLVKIMDDLWPGNPVIGEWMDAYDQGTANVSNPEMIETQAWLWRLGTVLLDIKNDLPPDPFIDTSGFLPTPEQLQDFLGDYWYNIFDNSGIIGPFDVQGLWDAIFNITPE